MVDETHEPAGGSSGSSLTVRGRRGSCSCASQTSSGSSARTRRWPSVCGSSSSPNQTVTSPPMTTGRSPISTTTTCVPRVWPGAGTSGARAAARARRRPARTARRCPGDPQVVSMNDSPVAEPAGIQPTAGRPISRPRRDRSLPPFPVRNLARAQPPSPTSARLSGSPIGTDGKIDGPMHSAPPSGHPMPSRKEL
jgi:hypothetical protein